MLICYNNYSSLPQLVFSPPLLCWTPNPALVLNLNKNLSSCYTDILKVILSYFLANFILIFSHTRFNLCCWRIRRNSINCLLNNVITCYHCNMKNSYFFITQRMGHVAKGSQNTHCPVIEHLITDSFLKSS